MPVKKLKLNLICGGQSTEHEISIISARNVIRALDEKKYTLSMTYISRNGKWYYFTSRDAFLAQTTQQLLTEPQAEPITILMGSRAAPYVSLRDVNKTYPVDCAFPLLHGTLGEDGTAQGLLEMLELPYVGSNTLGSAICMEKHITKRLLRFADLPTSDWQMISQSELDQYPYSKVSQRLGEVLFIKPVSLGSSVGISKVYNEEQYTLALQKAFLYDDQVLVEPHVNGREIECSVLGNEDPVASLPGEIVTTHDFYSYEAKYLDENGASVTTPADLPEYIVKKIQALSVQAFKTLQCSGMARVDFFVDGENITINEVNTIPGFTDISMYPKNWEASGLPYGELLDDLIELAIARYQRVHNFSRVRVSGEQLGKNKTLSPKGLE